MFFYDFENLDYFIKNHLDENIIEEEKRIDNMISLYDDKKVNLLNITSNMISITNILDKNKLDNFYKTITLLKNSFESLEEISNYTKIIKENLDSISSMCKENIDSNYNEIKANLVEYNKQDEKLQNQMLNYEKSITFVLNSTIELSLSVANQTLEPSSNKSSSNSGSILDSNLKEVLGDNNILLVSEKDQKAYLPYKYFTVKEFYENSKDKYNSIEDVIEELYVVPLNKFKSSSFSRFREGFNLIRNKEHGSVTKALDLGLELMFNYDLNPIIVAACRNLDELDIYLDCLEENELSDFDCFEIRFEIAPHLSKVRKNEFEF